MPTTSRRTHAQLSMDQDITAACRQPMPAGQAAAPACQSLLAADMVAAETPEVQAAGRTILDGWGGSSALRQAVLAALKFDAASRGGSGGPDREGKDRRHAEILDVMLLGITRDKAIAQALNMPVKTVQTHIARMKAATGTHDKAAFIAYVARLCNSMG